MATRKIRKLMFQALALSLSEQSKYLWAVCGLSSDIWSYAIDWCMVMWKNSGINKLNEKRLLILQELRVPIWQINSCSRVLWLSMLSWCRERLQTAICCLEWLGRLKCLATSLDASFCLSLRHKVVNLPSVDSAVDRTSSALDDGAEVETVEVVVDSVSSVTVGFAASVLEVVRGEERVRGQRKQRLVVHVNLAAVIPSLFANNIHQVIKYTQVAVMESRHFFLFNFITI